MANPSRSKRRSRIEPITVDELLSAAGMSGFVSFLNVKPEDYARPEGVGTPGPAPASTVECEPSATIRVDKAATVEAGPEPPVEAGLRSTIEVDTAAMVEAETPSTIVRGDIVVDSVKVPPTATVESDPRYTVAAEAASTIEGGPAGGYWTIEGIGGIFPRSRLRRIERAQDVLTHAEESVYDALWGVKDHSRDRYRHTAMGYEEIARKARASKRGVVGIIQRLIQKGFIEIASQPVTFGERRPTGYRVFSYATIREQQRAKGRVWTIRTGNGIGYAHPVSLEIQPASTVEAGPSSTIASGQPSTVVTDESATVGPGEPSTVEAASTGTSIDRRTSQEDPAATAAVVAAILETMGRADDDAAARIVEACRMASPDVTAEEIAYFVRQEAPALRRNRALENPMGVLIRHIPRCCRGEGLRLQREAVRLEQERSRRQAEAWLADARSILAMPGANAADRAWAEEILTAYGGGEGKS